MSRDTTLFRKPLTRSASMSVRQHSGFYNVRHSVAAYLGLLLFGAKLRDVFHICFLRPSHQPVAFCPFRKYVLVPITAILLQLPLL